jgi:predicted peroxiredoxin
MMKLNSALTGILAVLAILITSAAAADKSTILLNITSGPEDLHKVTMALQLGSHTLDDGRDLAVFLNVRSPVFAAKDCSAQLVLGKNPPVKAMLATLVMRGAKVHVCPHCMEALGIAAEDLIDGAQVTDREKLFGLLSPNTHVFTY